MAEEQQGAEQETKPLYDLTLNVYSVVSRIEGMLMAVLEAIRSINKRLDREGK